MPHRDTEKGHFVAEFPYLPLWTDNLIGATTHLTTEEFGAYVKLLICSWRSSSCDLPKNDILLARYAGVTRRRWAAMSGIILAFFYVVERHGELRIRQNRLREEKVFLITRSRKQSRNAKARWLKNNNSGHASGYATSMPDACQTDAPIPTPIPTPISKDIKKERFSLTGESPAEPDDGLIQPFSRPVIDAAVASWNALADRCGLARCQRLTEARRTQLRRRLADCGGISGWMSALEKIEKTPGLLGDNDRGWRANFDFLLQESRFTKLMEGGYDQWSSNEKRKRDKVDDVITLTEKYRRNHNGKQN